MARPGGVLLPPGVGFPPFQVVGVGVKEGGRKQMERERERGAAPPSLVQFGLPMGGGAPPPGLLPSLSPEAH